MHNPCCPESCKVDGISLRAVYADHGDLAPDAVGLLIEVDGIRIYHTGDTALRTEEILASLHAPVDIMLAPPLGAVQSRRAGSGWGAGLGCAAPRPSAAAWHVRRRAEIPPPSSLPPPLPENVSARVLAPVRVCVIDP